MLVISKTPLRMSFVGGGTDLPDFSDEHGGAVVSTTIDKWVHVIVAPRFADDLRVSCETTEVVENADEVRHELVRAALRATGITRGVEIVTLADVPSGGTGLGSSSAVTVGLLNALYAYRGVYRQAAELAEEASEIEIEVLGKPIGRQDQYAVATGGFNLIEFKPGGAGVRVEPIVSPPGTLERLHQSLLMFDTGRQRAAESVLEAQRSATQNGSAVATLGRMREFAYALRDALAVGHLDAFGELLHANWQMKRSLADVSSAELDGIYASARAAGAVGGKILGAGGGGFLLLSASTERHGPIRKALAGLREVQIRFTSEGTQLGRFEPVSR